MTLPRSFKPRSADTGALLTEKLVGSMQRLAKIALLCCAARVLAA